MPSGPDPEEYRPPSEAEQAESVRGILGLNLGRYLLQNWAADSNWAKHFDTLDEAKAAADRFCSTEAQQVITEGETLQKWTRNHDGSWSGPPAS